MWDVRCGKRRAKLVRTSHEGVIDSALVEFAGAEAGIGRGELGRGKEQNFCILWVMDSLLWCKFLRDTERGADLVRAGWVMDFLDGSWCNGMGQAKRGPEFVQIVVKGFLIGCWCNLLWDTERGEQILCILRVTALLHRIFMSSAETQKESTTICAFCGRRSPSLGLDYYCVKGFPLGPHVICSAVVFEPWNHILTGLLCWVRSFCLSIHPARSSITEHPACQTEIKAAI